MRCDIGCLQRTSHKGYQSITTQSTRAVVSTTANRSWIHHRNSLYPACQSIQSNPIHSRFLGACLPSSPITFVRKLSTKVPIPPSSTVEKYWDDVMLNSNYPDYYTLGYRDEPHSSTNDDELMNVQNNEKGVRKLVAGVVKAKREDGDIWPSLLTRQLCEFYENQDLTGRSKFLHILAKDFCIDLQETASAVQQFEESLCMTDRTVLRSSARLREALIPAYDTLFARINQLPGGMQFLVNMRADILSILDGERTSVHLKALGDSLKNRLQEWFGMGFLDLERITWHTPASILEKIISYEAVHAIGSWDGLKQRLGPGRLCYCFFHRGIPQEPLTFVQVALVNEVSTRIQNILTDPHPDTKDPTVAIFYSITSSQRGLGGVDLGNFLIKRVVKEIQLNHPTITTFSTLSPIPGFRSWLKTIVNGELTGVSNASHEPLLLSSEIEQLEKLWPSRSSLESLQMISEDTRWLDDPDLSRHYQPMIERLCSQYLILESKRSFALDPVGNFHLRNGAAIHQLNWRADTSDKGTKQSFGMMVNYIYNLDDVEANNQQYLLDGIIAVSNNPVQPALEWAFSKMRKRHTD
ncbi:hypothetical protein MT418_003693 [Batrachochytrium dendrobatidis]